MLLVYIPHSEYEVLRVWRSGSTNYEQLTRQPPGPAGDGLSGLEEQQRPRILSVDDMCVQSKDVRRSAGLGPKVHGRMQ